MKKQGDDKRFQTHIAEPRWQQVASVIIVLAGVIFWLFLFLVHAWR